MITNLESCVRPMIQLKTMDRFIKMRKLDPAGFFQYAKRTIEEITEVTNNHFLTQEISLHLITPNCSLWTANHNQCPFPDPFWAFYWPGGEALTRYLLDNKRIIRGKRVLDLGSGCGSLAIAAAKLGGAASVTANDIDPIAAVAIHMNASLNACEPKSIRIVTDNLLESTIALCKYDCIFLGDMFYDEKFCNELMKWLFKSLKTGSQVYIGDPGRHSKFLQDYKHSVKQVAQYKITEEIMRANDLTSSVINMWKLLCKK